VVWAHKNCTRLNRENKRLFRQLKERHVHNFFYLVQKLHAFIVRMLCTILNLDLVVLEPNFIREDSALVNNQTGSITIIQSKEEIQGVLTTTDWCNWH
jgi:hypothetical protein